MRLVTRKPVFEVCDQVRHKPACATTGASQRLKILDIETRDMTLHRQRTANVLIRLRISAGWSVPLLFAYGINRFSHDMAHMILCCTMLTLIVSKTEAGEDVYLISSRSLNLGGRRDARDNLATIPIHLSLSSAALRDSANSIPVDSGMLSSHLFFCLPFLLAHLNCLRYTIGS